MAIWFGPGAALPFFVALVTAALFAGPILRLLVAARSRQTVSQHAPEGHQKKQGTPTMGGLIVLVGLLAALPFTATRDMIPLDRPGDPARLQGASAWVLVLLVALFAVIGFLDDYVVPRMVKGSRGLSWRVKIVMQIVGAVLPLMLVVRQGEWLTVGVGVFLILLYSNAYNFSDGLDGLAGSLGLLLAGGFFFLTGLTLNPVLGPAAMALAGALIPFLFLNAPPARVFMGDVGSLPIGALFGWFAFELCIPVLSGVHAVDLLVPLVLLSLVMLAELIPVPLQIFSVKVFKKKLFPYTPIHHAFEKAGHPETRVVVWFVMVQLICVVASLTAVAFFMRDLAGGIGG